MKTTTSTTVLVTFTLLQLWKPLQQCWVHLHSYSYENHNYVGYIYTVTVMKTTTTMLVTFTLLQLWKPLQQCPPPLLSHLPPTAALRPPAGHSHPGEPRPALLYSGLSSEHGECCTETVQSHHVDTAWLVLHWDCTVTSCAHSMVSTDTVQSHHVDRLWWVQILYGHMWTDYSEYRYCMVTCGQTMVSTDTAQSHHVERLWWVQILHNHIMWTEWWVQILYSHIMWTD